jgi:DNA polymerase III sliding clamp (beta) subunit (PCNA family)
MITNIEIPVADLKSVLPGLSKIVGKRSTLPILGCVKVTLNENRTLQLQANNLDQIVTARLNKPFNGRPGQMLVPLDELSNIAKRCAATDIIELSLSGKETAITYPAAGTRIKKPVAHLAADEFPPEPEVNAQPVPLDNAFKEALQQAFDCVSDDSGRYVLTGACLDVSNKEAHYVVGTNGRHLFSANSFLFDVPQSIIIPPGKFLTWPGFMEDGPWTLRIQPEAKVDPETKGPGKQPWICLESDHWTYVSKPIDGAYPNWKQVLPPPSALKSHITLGEPGIQLILETLPLLPGGEERDQPVSLEIRGEALKLRARGKGDWTEIPIPAQVSGKSVSVAMNRSYLAKALKFGCAQIDIEGQHKPVLFRSKGKTMVICPLGPPDAPKVPEVPTAPATSPTENASPAAAPPAAEATTPTADPIINQPPVTENNEAATTTRGNLTTPPPQSEEAPAIDQMLAQIGTVREGVKKVLEDIGSTERLLRRAVKEQRLNEKEINRARSTLRSLQSVEL